MSTQPEQLPQENEPDQEEEHAELTIPAKRRDSFESTSPPLRNTLRLLVSDDELPLLYINCIEGLKKE
jgi:hypothetical protein